MMLLAQAETTVPFLDILHNLGTLGWVVVLLLLAVIWRDLDTIRKTMVTKDSLDVALLKVGEELRSWSDDRFLTRNECISIMGNNERIVNGHAEELQSLREEVSEHRRRKTDSH